MDKSLFEMIKNTHKKTPDYTVSAYSDNAAVLQGDLSNFWAPDYSTGTWRLSSEVLHPLIKVETHNHPTAISPFPGAATGSGGEIRVCSLFTFPSSWYIGPRQQVAVKSKTSVLLASCFLLADV